MSKHSLIIAWWAIKEIFYDRIFFKKKTPVEEGEKLSMETKTKKKKGTKVEGLQGLIWGLQEGLMAQ
jgi:hypothetical protein